MPSAEIESADHPDFCWGRKKGVGLKNKNVRFYESFTYDGVEYTLYDCVYLSNDQNEEHPHIGKIVKIWEGPDKSKKVKVQWFFRASEISYWLRTHNVEALENELFFATGQGKGLANVNPLEAISGKCSVVCISKDSRNPQLSAEHLQLSDYVFYRTFDVGQQIILDKLDDKVGGLEVKYLFNKQENEMITCPKTGPKTEEEDGKITVLFEETLQVSNKNLDEIVGTITSDGNHSYRVGKEDMEANYLLVKDEPFGGCDKKVKNGIELPNQLHMEDNTILVNEDNRATTTQDKVAKDKKCEHSCSFGDGKPSKILKVEGMVKLSGVEKKNCTNEVNDPTVLKGVTKRKRPTLHEEDVKAISTKGDDSTLNQEDSKISLVDSFKNEGSSSIELFKDGRNSDLGKDRIEAEETKCEEDSNSLANKPPKRPKVVKLVRTSEIEKMNHVSKPCARGEVEGNEPIEKLGDGSGVKGDLVVGSSLNHEREKQNAFHDVNTSQPVRNSSLGKRPLENMGKPMKTHSKLDKDPFSKIHDGEKKENLIESKGSSKEGLDLKLVESGSSKNKGPSFGVRERDNFTPREKLIGKSTMQNAEASFRKKCEPVKVVEEKHGNQSSKRSSYNSNISHDVGKIYEVTPKPNTAGKWFTLKKYDWENLNGCERRIILLQNLDPEYTSRDVEDILWSVFQERCDVKVVQRTALSSPHYGQALAILRSREVAEEVVGKLNEGCLLISDQRVLFASIVDFPLPVAKQLNFLGHLFIDQVKRQKRRDKIDVQSTSHFAQPNTVEHELAMEWCLLQSRFDFSWKRLQKLQGAAFSKCMAKFNSNTRKQHIHI